MDFRHRPVDQFQQRDEEPKARYRVVVFGIYGLQGMDVLAGASVADRHSYVRLLAFLHAVQFFVALYSTLTSTLRFLLTNL